MVRPSIMIVESDKELADSIGRQFAAESYDIQRTESGSQALRLMQEQAPDVLIMDWSMSDITALDLCFSVRGSSQTENTQIVVMSANNNEDERIKCFSAGADDFVDKPFAPRELFARVNSMLVRRRDSIDVKSLQFADLKVDPVSHRVWRNGSLVHLAPTEYRLLFHFIKRPQRAYSRQQLLDAVWGRRVKVDSRTIDVHIRRLRKALNRPGDKDLIRTIRAVGYALDLE
ncbi:MAG: winged helix-turn-helix domain-containing protein [Novosphingobium sp.]